MLRSTAIKNLFTAGIAAAAVLAVFPAARAEEPPARPEFGVIDDASLFPLPILKATEKMLAEHEQATRERISIVTAREAPAGDAEARARGLHAAWRNEAPRPPDSIVLFVAADSGELAIATGLGLDPLLPAARIAEIRRGFFRPEWANGKKSRALVLSLIEVLRAIESPLIASGEATDALERAGFAGGWAPIGPPKRNTWGWLWAAAGLLVFGVVLRRVLVAEVHYAAGGWDRIPAWRGFRRFFRRGRRRGPALVTGGGVSGRY